jgi:hypothetical protein
VKGDVAIEHRTHWEEPMSCCGGNRAALRAQFQQARSFVPPVPAAPVLLRPVPLMFTGEGPIVARGSVTGLTYAFPAGESLAVDSRDVPGLLSSGAFHA